MSSGDYSGEYQCECEKKFTNSQKFNGHKTHCKIHLQATGKYEQRIEAQKKFVEKGINASKTKSENAQEKRKINLTKWLQEQPTCEKCGKIITTKSKYGNGKFCSRSCANTHNKKQKYMDLYNNHPAICVNCKYTLTHDERNLKICPYCGYYLTGEKAKSSAKHMRKILDSLVSTEIRKKLSLINMPEDIEKFTNSGYFSRNKLSYAEQFWKRVLDNNNVPYEHEFKVPNRERTAFYRLDFLIEGKDGKIDLEIDGSQHEKRPYKDIVRQIYLEELEYKVFRIKWVNPINDINKLIVNCQIQQMLDFIGYPRIY